MQYKQISFLVIIQLFSLIISKENDSLKFLQESRIIENNNCSNKCDYTKCSDSFSDCEEKCYNDPTDNCFNKCLIEDATCNTICEASCNICNQKCVLCSKLCFNNAECLDKCSKNCDNCLIKACKAKSFIDIINDLNKDE